MNPAKIGIICAVALSLSSTTAVVMPQPAEAGFKDALKKTKRKMRKARKRVSRKLRSKKVKRAIGVAVGVGVGIAAGKALGGGRGAVAGAIIGGVIATQASKSFRQDLARSYKNDFGWAGCISCGKRRIRVAPGRKATKKQRSAVRKVVKSDAIELQTALKTLGYYKKRIDGDFGRGSREAVKDFQTAEKLPSTGRLSAELRALLFARAAQAGYVRDGYTVQTKVEPIIVPQVVAAPVILASAALAGKPAEAKVAETKPVVVAKAAAGKPFKRAIRQYRLASSQFDKFSKNALAGPNSAVVESSLARDGTLDLTVEILGEIQSQKKKFNIGIEDIDVRRHPDFSSWTEVRAKVPGSATSIVLNAVDTFNTEAEAAMWLRNVQKKMTILAKLTDRDVEVKERTLLVASAQSNAASAPKIAVASLTSDQEPSVVETSPEIAETSAPSDARKTALEIAAEVAPEATTEIAKDLEPLPELFLAKAEIEDKPVETAISTHIDTGADEPEQAETVESKPITPASSLELAETTLETGLSVAESEASIQLASLTAPADLSVPKTCSDTIYLSFSFPESVDDINHYNITPPVDTLMMDNGDSTAYFTGTCVQGSYDYQYVYVEKGKTKENWKHHVRKGSFQVAGKVEQCDVNVNDPTGSATVVCF